MKNRIRKGMVLTLAMFMAMSLSVGTAFADDDKKDKKDHDDVITIVGPAGPQGPIGLTGAAGTNGTNGADGATGPIGLTGAAGTNGTNGADGATGPIGLTGAAGTNGTNGADGATGPIGLTGAAGTNGTNGADGAVGATGFNGADGAQGSIGPIGLTGPQGPGFTPAELNAAICGLYDAAGAARPAICPYAVGDTGPAGGIVFHVDATGTHGLEYAPDVLGPAVWGCGNLAIPGTWIAGSEVPSQAGTSGAAATAAILAACTDPGIAARLADAYVSPNGTTGWFLPGVAEGQLLYQSSLGSLFLNYTTWTSNQYASGYIYGVGNNGVGSIGQTLSVKVIPVHAF